MPPTTRAAEPVVLLSPACASYDQFPNSRRAATSSARSCVSLNGVTSEGEAA